MSETVLVAGALAAKPGNGGNAWARLAYLLGFRRLGFATVLLEQADTAADAGRAFFEDVCARFDIEGFLVLGGQVPAELEERAGAAALLVNLSGNLTHRALKRAPRRRVYVDDDPGYTQYWQAAGLLGARLDEHDVYFTYGTAIGSPRCSIPSVGLDWRPLLPPVVLDEWPVAAGGDAFTTVASWRGGYGRLEVEGRLLGQKAHEFRRLLELPQRTGRRFELALASDEADAGDRDDLLRHGWTLRDPVERAGDPDRYRAYIQGSYAEFSAAQGAYVETRSGWFSDRTAAYLASGKPALVQDTGFGGALPVGRGLLSFSDLDEAVAGVRAIEAEHAEHAAAARALAETHLDSDVVLGRLLEEAGL